MKLRTLPLLVALGLAAVTSARAELVRLSFTDWQGFFIWKADSAAVSWNTNPGYITHLEIYYDTLSLSEATLDPDRNFFRFSILGPRRGDQFTVSRPLEHISYSLHADGSQQMEFTREQYDPDFGVIDLFATFHGPLPAEGSLPIPSYRLDSNDLYHIDGGPAWFPVPHMAEGYGYGSFQFGRAMVANDTGGFSAVPEPATYGVAGAGVLMVAAMLRRRMMRPAL